MIENYEADKKYQERIYPQTLGDCGNRETTLSENLERRIRELRVELIELEALKRIVETEPIINKVFSGEQGRKLRQYL